MRVRLAMRGRAALGVAMVAPMVGCSIAGDGRRPLESSDFVGEAPVQPIAPAMEGPEIPVVRLEPEATLAEVEASPGAPELDPNAMPVDEGSPVLVDELVGEINGKPIFVNEFLEVLSGTLRAIPVEFERQAGRRPTPNEWRREAAFVIENELNRLIQDELVSAESYRTLTVPEANLRYLLEWLRNNQISLRGGSAAAADRSIREEKGISTDEYTEQRKDEFVLQQYLREMATAISISPRDIRRYYNRNYERFNPPPEVRFRWIRVSQNETDAIERISAALADGEPFEEVARDEANRFNQSEGGLRTQTIDGELVNARLLADETLNAALVSLEPGEWAGPYETGSSVSWVMLERVRSVSQSLYDAQATIEEELWLQERQRRLNRELERLRERAGISNEQIGEIKARLVEIAEERFMEGTG